MGIRFFCPNGHKLNVKEFQRGLAGICPHCGARLHVPLASTRRSSRAKNARSPGDASQASEAEVTIATSLPQPASSGPGSVTGASDVAEEPPGPFSVFAASAASYPATAPASRFASGNGPRDLLADGGAWFVRPPSGGQFGPATADILQTWLAEGRLTADTLVWREGWLDWRPAGQVLPQLSSRLPMPEMEDFDSEFDEPVSPSHAAKGHDRPRSPHTVAVGMMILVGLCLSLALIAVLLKIF